MIVTKLRVSRNHLKGWGGHLKGQNKKKRNMLREELTSLELLEEDGPLDEDMALRKM